MSIEWRYLVRRAIVLLGTALRHALPWDPEQGDAPVQMLGVYTAPQYILRGPAGRSPRASRRRMYFATVSYRGIEEWVDPQPEWTR